MTAVGRVGRRGEHMHARQGGLTRGLFSASMPPPCRLHAAAIRRNQAQSDSIRLHLDRGAHARRVDEREHVVEPAVLGSDEPSLGVFKFNLARGRDQRQ